jgi:hypothetical protein
VFRYFLLEFNNTTQIKSAGKEIRRLQRPRNAAASEGSTSARRTSVEWAPAGDPILGASGGPSRAAPLMRG